MSADHTLFTIIHFTDWLCNYVRREVAGLETPIDIQKIPVDVRAIIERLDQHGYESWLVGGCVRDLCLGLVPKDYDVATSARPDEVRQVFPHNFATGLQHGTVTVIWGDVAVEITTFRSESSYSDSRRPDIVVFHNEVEADLARRDFTMNSMAWRPDRGLLDLHGGLEDLRQGLLRTVGNARIRFSEDVLRILRAIRFAVTYDLTPDPDLVEAAAEQAGQLGRLSRERIAGEMMRILGAPYPQQLLSFQGCGILSAAAVILLQVEGDDRAICKTLSSLVSASLPASMRLPVFLLAAAAPVPDRSAIKRFLQPYFRVKAGHQILHLLMYECRVSRHLSQDGEAMLYLFYLRLLLPLDQPLAPVTQRRLLRLLARRGHLDSSQLGNVADEASHLCQLFFGSVPLAPTEPCFRFDPDITAEAPLTIAELALNGRQLHLAGWPSGPAMRRILELLLSGALTDSRTNRPARLLMRAWGYGGRSDKRSR